MHGGHSNSKRAPVTYSPIFWLLAQFFYLLAWLVDKEAAEAHKAQQQKRSKRH